MKNADAIARELDARMRRILEEARRECTSKRSAPRFDPLLPPRKRKPHCQHWRSAHWKNVACGKGWKQHRRRWVERFRAGDPAEAPSATTLARWLRKGLSDGFNVSRGRAA